MPELLDGPTVRRILRAITRDDVIAAIADLDRGERGDFGPQVGYDLVFGGRRYPPKAVVGFAARRQIGRPLSHNEFSGGNGRTQANGVLRALGFEVVELRVTVDPTEQPAAVTGSDWSDNEVAVAVDVYFAMLRRQLDRESFVKREALAVGLSRLPGRTRGALEYKLENISAVLNRLELSWLGGYVPAQNYQRRVEDAVLAVLVADPALVLRLQEADSSVPARPVESFATEDVLTEPPPATAAGSRDTVSGPHLVRGGWAASHDEANRKLGADGERWVVDLEREKLRRAGRMDLAERVDHVALRVDGLGYDVVSFDLDGVELHIEVKTTKSGPRTAFVITPNEVRTSRSEPANFRLYRVYDFGPSARLFILSGDLEPLLDLTPTQFSARLK
jgi:hypothetical protein